MTTEIHRDGVLALPGLLTPAQVAEASALVRAATADGIDASGVRVFMPGRIGSGLLGLMTGGRMARAVQAAIGDSEFLSYKAVVKDGARAFATPWHQDRPYWGGCVKWSLWIALTPVGVDDGCLRIVRGSHRDEVRHAAHAGGAGFANRLAEPDPATVEDVLLAPGDAVLFHDLLWHASRPITSGRSRLALIPTYRARGAVDASRVWAAPVPLEAA